MKEQRVIVFWNYDQFPYCLWDEVRSFEVGGRVKLVNYGGMTVKPIAVFEYDEGVHIGNRLEDIRKSFIEESGRLRNNYIMMARQSAPFISK